jgi:GNAT superfamily N-acetyltransferase
MSVAAIRAPRREEIARVWEMIAGLAGYERLERELVGSAERLAADLFAERPPIECRVAERGGALVGYALFFPVYSSFHTQPAMWLEDIYVESSERGHGTGRGLIAEVARLALARGCGRLAWVVLDWNRPSIEFYERLGARATEGWLQYGLDVPAMERLTAPDGIPGPREGA